MPATSSMTAESVRRERHGSAFSLIMVASSVPGILAPALGGWLAVDAAGRIQPGTVLVIMEPLYANGLDRVIPGSSCIANAYTSNHEEIANPATGTMRRIALMLLPLASLACAAAASCGFRPAGRMPSASRRASPCCRITTRFPSPLRPSSPSPRGAERWSWGSTRRRPSSGRTVHGGFAAAAA